MVDKVHIKTCVHIHIFKICIKKSTERKHNNMLLKGQHMDCHWFSYMSVLTSWRIFIAYFYYRLLNVMCENT